jgi:hypothetical protein
MDHGPQGGGGAAHEPTLTRMKLFLWIIFGANVPIWLWIWVMTYQR